MSIKVVILSLETWMCVKKETPLFIFSSYIWRKDGGVWGSFIRQTLLPITVKLLGALLLKNLHLYA
jgi:hypothetical protein